MRFFHSPLIVAEWAAAGSSNDSLDSLYVVGFSWILVDWRRALEAAKEEVLKRLRGGVKRINAFWLRILGAVGDAIECSSRLARREGWSTDRSVSGSSRRVGRVV